MIISDVHEIAFVHIPKCGGTTVRKSIKHLDDTSGKFSSRIDDHEELGVIDYVHIPLFTLKNHFPKIFDKVASYQCYSSVRKPIDRFASSFSHFINTYSDRTLKKMSKGTIREKLYSVIEHIESLIRKESLFPRKYIHFQPQEDFIYIKGKQIVENLYTIENIQEMIKDIKVQYNDKNGRQSTKTNKRRNETLVYKNRKLGNIYEKMKKPLKQIMPKYLVSKASSLARSFIYDHRKNKIGDLFRSKFVKDFVRNFYRQDIKLYKSIRK